MTNAHSSNRHPDEPVLLGPFAHPGHPLTLAIERDSDQEPQAELPTSLWVNVREEATQWMDSPHDLLSLTNSTLLACGLQGLGLGVLALSYEESAYTHYALVGNRLRHAPQTVVQGLEQTLKDLHEAYTQWVSVGYWVERVAQVLSPTSPELDPLRLRVHSTRAHQQRLLTLIAHVHEDRAQTEARVQRRNRARQEGQS